jgi:hypothetical protein
VRSASPSSRSPHFPSPQQISVGKQLKQLLDMSDNTKIGFSVFVSAAWRRAGQVSACLATWHVCNSESLPCSCSSKLRHSLLTPRVLGSASPPAPPPVRQAAAGQGPRPVLRLDSSSRHLGRLLLGGCGAAPCRLCDPMGCALHTVKARRRRSAPSTSGVGALRPALATDRRHLFVRSLLRRSLCEEAMPHSRPARVSLLSYVPGLRPQIASPQLRLAASRDARRSLLLAPATFVFLQPLCNRKAPLKFSVWGWGHALSSRDEGRPSVAASAKSLGLVYCPKAQGPPSGPRSHVLNGAAGERGFGWRRAGVHCGSAPMDGAQQLTRGPALMHYPTPSGALNCLCSFIHC